jgi:hypothetical protein
VIDAASLVQTTNLAVIIVGTVRSAMRLRVKSSCNAWLVAVFGVSDLKAARNAHSAAAANPFKKDIRLQRLQ